MTETTSQPEAENRDEAYDKAVASIQKTLDKLRGCNNEEKDRLQSHFMQLEEMNHKLTCGRVEIVVFGEISTGKSALINALVGDQVAEVDVQGGWTKEAWNVAWDGAGYCVPGFAESEVVLIDTPGVNEVGGSERADIARDAASRADMILFVVDSDLNDVEYAALVELAAAHKPIVVVFNKIDLYSRDQIDRLTEVIFERLGDMIPHEHMVMTKADPRELEYVIESADGSQRTEWKKPQPDVEDLKVKILTVLEKDGLSLLALNAAMYAADKSDRIASLRIELRTQRANQIIWSYATIKALAVGWNPIPYVDVLGGTTVDATMIVTLAKVYGIEMNWLHARKLAKSIVQAAGWIILGELAIHATSAVMKLLSFGTSTPLSAIPQGAAAGYGSYVVGQAAKYYLEHGASWGSEGPKAVVNRILDETDKDSVLDHLKDEIRKKLQHNPHSRQ